MGAGCKTHRALRAALGTRAGCKTDKALGLGLQGLYAVHDLVDQISPWLDNQELGALTGHWKVAIFHQSNDLGFSQFGLINVDMLEVNTDAPLNALC